MANTDHLQLRHLILENTAQPESYTHPSSGGSGENLTLPQRDRASHANSLLDDLSRVNEAAKDLKHRRQAIGVGNERGIYLEFESEPGFELALPSLDRTRSGIELVAARDQDDKTIATVFVPDGKLKNFEKLFLAYRDEERRSGQPKNKTLAESTSAIRQAILESFWTDRTELLPEPEVAIWWEVWLRTGSVQNTIVQDFKHNAVELGLQVEPRQIDFPDRTVILVYGTPEQMSLSTELLDSIAELRKAKESAEFFAAMDAKEQGEWIDDLLARTNFDSRDHTPAICILDTGINRSHPLLTNSLAAHVLLTCNPTWGAHDHQGHGTSMAGLALFGDLLTALSSNDIVDLEHRLESVKILPPPSQPPNPPELYGSITIEGIGRIEIVEPSRSRVFCMAVTTQDDRDRGKPSSWSAAIDSVCSGIQDEFPRLVIISAGNVEPQNWHNYPDQNDVDQIHDPGQSWNALTIGAYTEKYEFDTSVFPGWVPIAAPGGLSPSSTTSVTWSRLWPNKPDIVFEGGNGICVPGTEETDTDHPLQLLTTHWQPIHRLMTTIGDTSAATAQAANMAAILMNRYPNLWPETIRALMVHSADWTEEMLRTTDGLSPSRKARLLLRRYGYGVPNIDRACWSASNVLTLIAQDTLQPFEKLDSGRIATKDMNLHRLPWPSDELSALGETPVELRVTLSYFIEPNPARRGWIRKFRYQSHGLRFEIRRPTENIDDFRARVTKDARDEERGTRAANDRGWVIGPQERRRGSIHSDTWKGVAIDLAERESLAVFPVGGWWKERAHLGRWERSVRYTLLVTIKTPETDIDIYTPVANQITVPTTITVGTE